MITPQQPSSTTTKQYGSITPMEQTPVTAAAATEMSPSSNRNGRKNFNNNTNIRHRTNLSSKNHLNPHQHYGHHYRRRQRQAGRKYPCTHIIQVYVPKLVLEVFGGTGAVWGFSEALGLRTSQTVWFWRPFSLCVGLLFFMRWLKQIRNDLYNYDDNNNFIFDEEQQQEQIPASADIEVGGQQSQESSFQDMEIRVLQDEEIDNSSDAGRDDHVARILNYDETRDLVMQEEECEGLHNAQQKSTALHKYHHQVTTDTISSSEEDGLLSSSSSPAPASPPSSSTHDEYIQIAIPKPLSIVSGMSPLRNISYP